MKKNQASKPRPEAHQTVCLPVDTKDGQSSIRISFTDQKLTAHGGMIVWSHFLKQKKVRQQLDELLPQEPSSPNAYDPSDIALSYMSGILCGADKLSRVAWLQSDGTIARVLGVEAVASQSTLSRFFAGFSQRSCQVLSRLHPWAAGGLPSLKGGYTLDLDSWALLHKDGHQEGVAPGYTPRGLKPCHRPILAALAESRLVVNYWLRSGDTVCVNSADEFLRQSVESLPSHIQIGLVRGDAGFGNTTVQEAAEALGLKYILAWRLSLKLQGLCRHQDQYWKSTPIKGLEVQEVQTAEIGRRVIVVRQRIMDRPQAGGKNLLEVPGYRFQALSTNLASSVEPVEIWRRYQGRADLENRIKELGQQFGIKGLCVHKFWGTEAMHHLAVAAYNLCVLLQRRLGQLEKCELHTLRWRLFCRAGIWSRAGGKPTLKLAVSRGNARLWWLQILMKLSGPPNCYAVDSLQA